MRAEASPTLVTLLDGRMTLDVVFPSIRAATGFAAETLLALAWSLTRVRQLLKTRPETTGRVSERGRRTVRRPWTIGAPILRARVYGRSTAPLPRSFSGSGT